MNQPSDHPSEDPIYETDEPLHLETEVIHPPLSKRKRVVVDVCAQGDLHAKENKPMARSNGQKRVHSKGSRKHRG